MKQSNQGAVLFQKNTILLGNLLEAKENSLAGELDGTLCNLECQVKN